MFDATVAEPYVDVLERPTDRLGEIPRSGAARDESRLEVCEQLGSCTCRRANDGTTARKSLDRGDPEAFIGSGGQNEEIRGAVETWQAFLRHSPEQAHTIAETEGRDELAKTAGEHSVPGDRKREVGSRLDQQMDCVQELLEPHAWLEATHCQKQRTVNRSADLCTYCVSGCAREGNEPSDVDTTGDEHSTIPRRFVRSQKQVSAELAQDEDPIGSADRDALQQHE